MFFTFINVYKHSQMLASFIHIWRHPHLVPALRLFIFPCPAPLVTLILPPNYHTAPLFNTLVPNKPSLQHYTSLHFTYLQASRLSQLLTCPTSEQSYQFLQLVHKSSLGDSADLRPWASNPPRLQNEAITRHLQTHS